MKIRTADHEDCQSLALLNREVQNPHADSVPHMFKHNPDSAEMCEFFEELLNDSDNRIFIIANDGQDLGYIFCQMMRRSETAFMYAYSLVYVHHIAVLKDSRGSGCGRRLIEAAYQLAEEEQINQIALDVWSFNTNAQAFFKHMGFDTFNLRMNYWLTEAGGAQDPQSVP